MPEHWEVDQAATREARARLRQQHRRFTLLQASRPTSIAGRHLCFASRATLAVLEIESGIPIEILGPAGAPLRLWMEQEEGVPDASLAVDAAAVQILNVAFGDTCQVRRLRTVRG